MRGRTMIERLTRAQMMQKYPEQYLGLSNVKYHGATVLEGDVVSRGNRSEIFHQQMETDGKVILFYTGQPTGMSVGTIG